MRIFTLSALLALGIVLAAGLLHPPVLAWTDVLVCPGEAALTVSPAADPSTGTHDVACVAPDGTRSGSRVLAAVAAAYLLTFTALNLGLRLLGIGRREYRPLRVSRAGASAPALDAATAAEVRRELTGGQKIRAIKIVRDATGMGLRDAKALVERTGHDPAAPDASAPPRARGIDAEVAAEVRALLAAGRPVQAVKAVRAATGLGLKDAKELVDRAIADPAVLDAPHPPREG